MIEEMTIKSLFDVHFDSHFSILSIFLRKREREREERSSSFSSSFPFATHTHNGVRARHRLFCVCELRPPRLPLPQGGRGKGRGRVRRPLLGRSARARRFSSFRLCFCSPPSSSARGAGRVRGLRLQLLVLPRGGGRGATGRDEVENDDDKLFGSRLAMPLLTRRCFSSCRGKRKNGPPCI